MNKTFFALFTFILLSLGEETLAQRPVSSALQNRKVLLEQFTGIHCPTCPNGHRIADSLKAVKPTGSVLLVNIHTGIPAAPNSGDPDLRFSNNYATSLFPSGGGSTFPSAYVNRQRFGTNPSSFLTPTQWSVAIDSVQSEISPYNLALDGTLNVATGYLTVSTQFYRHSFVPMGTYVSSCIYLLEDGVLGTQLGSALYLAQIDTVSGYYKQNHVLRKDGTTPAYGSPIQFASAGNTSQNFYYTVPAQYANSPVYLGNLRVIAFLVDPSDSTIITAATGPITLTGFSYAKDAQLMSEVRIEKEVCEATLKPIVRIYNNGSQSITGASLQSSLNGGAFLPSGSFSGSIAPATSALVAVPQISFSPNASNAVKFKITAVNGSPDANGANDTLTVSNILRTTRLSKGKYQVMRFFQDRYGAETTWKIVEEGSGVVKLAGGPYPNLANNGIAAHVDSFLATGETCYEIIVSDAGGNGINSGSGLGNYKVTSNGLVIYASNGAYGFRDRALFKTAENLTILPSSIAGIPEFEKSVSLAPNPAAGETRLLFSLAKGTKLSVQVLDMTGRVVAQITDQNLSAGSHALPVSTANLAGGVYNIRLTTAEGVVTRRLVVLK